MSAEGTSSSSPRKENCADIMQEDLHDDSQACMNKEEKKHMPSSDKEDKDETHAATSQPQELIRPCIRSGVFAGEGSRHMQDRHVVIDDVGPLVVKDSHMQIKSVPTSFYAVFDGHGKEHAAEFANKQLFSNFIDMMDKQKDISSALVSAFLDTDTQFKNAWLENKELASGTTALAAVIAGSELYVANAGDCRAVICRNGKALDMSVDHDPRQNKDEYDRIIRAGGYLEEGYLNGIINMSRAIGDWDHKGLKGPGPLIACPEIKLESLTEEDEFMIVASDGLFKWCSSQRAVDFVRRELEKDNDLEKCARALAIDTWHNPNKRRFLKDDSTVVIVTFQKEAHPHLLEGQDNINDPMKRRLEEEPDSPRKRSFVGGADAS